MRRHRRHDSWWRTYDEYGQWSFAGWGAIAALGVMLAMILLAQQLAWMLGA